MIEQLDWATITALKGDALKGSVFEILRMASLEVNNPDRSDVNLLPIIPRLADIIAHNYELKSYREPFSALARAVGLWNYIDKEFADTSDRLVAEAVTVPELEGITLHREQIGALNEIFAGRNLVLSAPTSFGKSLLIDAILASGKYRRVAIVVPTIALLDETRRRIRRRFPERYDIVAHGTDVAYDRPTVFLGTQERIINRSDLGTLDIVIVDEFYKLDGTRSNERSVTLNAAVYKLLNKSRQFFFLGPNIDNVHLVGDSRWKFQFLRTKFATVAVETYELKGVVDKQERLLEELGDDTHWPALVFVSSPNRANRLAIASSDEMSVSDDSSELAHWMSENFGPSWPLIEAVKHGFGVHHARMPRALSSRMVRMFNDLQLPVLFCTSTLIEGVNTAAKTVMIYDKEIDREDFDFFTFANIRGRAGRLGKHHVGRVLLFNEPPLQTEMDVSPTVFGDEESAPDDYVVQISPEDSETQVDPRITQLQNTLGLTRAELKVAVSLGIETAEAIRREVSRRLAVDPTLAWERFPNYEELSMIAEVAFAVRRPSDLGANTAKQLAYFISRLSQATTMREFFLEYDQKYKGDPESYDTIFRFLRACEYGLPQILSVIEIFVRKRYSSTNYRHFIGELSHWFRPSVLRELDEEGVPIQITERFYRNGDTRKQLAERLLMYASSPSKEMDVFEREWVTGALA